MQPTQTVLIVSSELDAAKTVEAVKAMHGLKTHHFIYLIEDYLGVATCEKERPENFIVRDFAALEDIKAVLHKIDQQYDVSLVISCDEFAVYVAAFANDFWQLTGITCAEARKFRDKKRMKELAQQAGIATAREITLQNIENGDVAFPVIVKPRSLAGSMGIKIVSDAKQLADIDIDWSPEYRDMDERQYLIEQYNPNTIYHIDCVVINGRLSFISVGEYLGKPINFLQEKPVGVLSVCDHTVEDVWQPFTEKVLAAFDAPEGVYHIEAFADSGAGVELLEIAWRPGGAAIVEMVEMVYGLNLKHIHLAAQLGLDVGLLVQRREEAFGYMTFPKKHLATQTLYVTRVHLPPLQHMATLKSHKVPVAGDIASGEFYCYKDSLGSFVFCGDREQVSRDVNYLNAHYLVQVAPEYQP
ncbi:ATP-grasp domain-containing protein [Pantoea stewartii]|uniref:Nikkomycin biosynthesis domain protein n=2 Tax=Pantoea stewartii subsp. stewartii TaxID=66271 RepID=H3RK28_PANSE|nr:ATP-grasp domain-containing protein [Pantoea stewartii]ARF52515.1 serine kinase [Pantoea stewartii subsp. stewartii DC283]EHT98069.1 nikkomycin biosynthesis domain protein [Pantoea stewartii subsp. stewartii DC283]KAB0552720.1 ATP-grasp domain-containing protein [Pantoea stewartii subsp. stewartii]